MISTAPQFKFKNMVYNKKIECKVIDASNESSVLNNSNRHFE